MKVKLLYLQCSSRNVAAFPRTLIVALKRKERKDLMFGNEGYSREKKIYNIFAKNLWSFAIEGTETLRPNYNRIL